MYNIFNDFSLVGQYANEDDFFSDLLEHILPILKHARSLNIAIMKSYDTYNLKVTNTKTLLDFLHISGNAEITAIKLYLVDITSIEPYWNNDIKTELTSNYFFNNNVDIPNCLSEALERKRGLISFPYPPFNCNELIIKKDNVDYAILNSYNRNTFLRNLYLLDIINESYYMENISIGVNITFCRIHEREYTQEFFIENHLDKKDRMRVTDKIILLSSHIVEKTDPGTLCKSLDDGLWELRNGLSDDRIFRIFYIYHSTGIVFLNGFIKKSQDTPQNELKLARSLAKKYN